MDEPAQREIAERQPPLPMDASPAPTPRSTGRWNFVMRHWRGELPLWVSFWIVTVLGSLPLCMPIFVAGTMLGYDNFSARRIFLMVFGAGFATVLMALWQLVGTWRSAWKYKQSRIRWGRSTVWGSVTYLIVAPATLLSFRCLLFLGYLVAVATPILFLNDAELQD